MGIDLLLHDHFPVVLEYLEYEILDPFLIGVGVLIVDHVVLDVLGDEEGLEGAYESDLLDNLAELYFDAAYILVEVLELGDLLYDLVHV